MRRIVGYIFLAAILIATIAYSSLQPNHKTDPDLESYFFSNTQTWDHTLFAYTYADYHYSSLNWNSIKLDPPTKNGSKETKKELDEIVAMIPERESEKQKILDEVYYKSTSFGQCTIQDYFNSSVMPHTAELLQDSWEDMTIQLFRHKKEFDRVRPSYLEPLIQPIITIPGHPAYPSGHATESRFLALILSDLDPTNKAVYEDRSIEIAHHREVAGVHYPSDSRAGQSLASSVYELLKTDVKFNVLLQSARQEWLSVPACK